MKINDKEFSFDAVINDVKKKFNYSRYVITSYDIVCDKRFKIRAKGIDCYIDATVDGNSPTIDYRIKDAITSAFKDLYNIDVSVRKNITRHTYCTFIVTILDKPKKIWTEEELQKKEEAYQRKRERARDKDAKALELMNKYFKKNSKKTCQHSYVCADGYLRVFKANIDHVEGPIKDWMGPYDYYEVVEGFEFYKSKKPTKLKMGKHVDDDELKRDFVKMKLTDFLTDNYAECFGDVTWKLMNEIINDLNSIPKDFTLVANAPWTPYHYIKDIKEGRKPSEKFLVYRH